jgi:hypothetical protein
MEQKSICTTKEIVTRLKRWLTEWEKTFDKELITRIYRELKRLDSQNINDPMKKMDK